MLFSLMSLSVVAAVAPGPPRSLVASVSGDTVTLVWQPPSTGGVPTSYVIEASLSPGGPIMAALPVLNTTLVVPNVPNGVYYVRVRSVNNDGPSDVSNEVIVPVPSSSGGCSSPPNPPTQLNSNVSGNLVTLAWAVVGGCAATDFVVQAGSAPGLSDLAIVNNGAATTLVASAPAGTYYVRVIALNAFGASGASNEIVLTVGTTCQPPTSGPLLLQPTVNGNNVSLNWVSPGGVVTGYIVEAGTSPGATNLGSTSLVVGTDLTIGNAPSGTLYFRVRAVNGCGLGPVSNEVVVTVGSGDASSACRPTSALCG
jgi:predicted phage tail protein